MAVLPMKRVWLYGHRSIRATLLERAQEMSLLHLLRCDDPEGPLSEGETRVREDETAREELHREVEELESRIRGLEETITFLEGHAPPQGFLESLSPGARLHTPESFLAAATSEGVQELVSRIHDVEGRFGEIASAIETKVARTRMLESWLDCPLPLHRLGELTSCQVLAGHLPIAVSSDEERRLERKLACMVSLPLSQDSKGRLLLLVVHDSVAPRAREELRLFGFEERELPQLDGDPAHEARRLFDEIDALREEERKLRIESRALASRRFTLMAVADHGRTRLARLRREAELFETPSAFRAEAWIRARDLPLLQRLVQELRYCALVAGDPPPDETPPVALENPPSLKPFEVVTELYGVPQYGEFDPTPLLAPFFALFFALCLTDAGYGLLLLLGAGWLIHRSVPEGSSRALLNLLMLMGCLTMVVGLLTGGVFGIAIDAPNSALAFLKTVRLLDPNTQQIQFFALSIALGFIHVAFGHVVKAWWNLRHGHPWDALFDQGTWLLIMAGVVGYLLRGTIWPDLPTLPFTLLLLAGVCLIVLFGGRDQSNPLLRMASGLFTLYGVTGLMGDVLSYSRLLALGMATGVIAGVVNTLAAMAYQLPSVIGVAGMVVILVVGHLMNLAISALGAFVHTIRLQFVEFFTKFYEGGGQAFTPLAVERKYCKLRPSEDEG